MRVFFHFDTYFLDSFSYAFFLSRVIHHYEIWVYFQMLNSAREKKELYWSVFNRIAVIYPRAFSQHFFLLSWSLTSLHFHWFTLFYSFYLLRLFWVLFIAFNAKRSLYSIVYGFKASLYPSSLFSSSLPLSQWLKREINS